MRREGYYSKMLKEVPKNPDRIRIKTTKSKKTKKTKNKKKRKKVKKKPCSCLHAKK